MRSFPSILFFAISAVVSAAQYFPVVNYGTGIDVDYLKADGVTVAENGEDFMEEYLYFDPAINGRKVVYVKSPTKFRMGHNLRNVTSAHGIKHERVGANGKDGIPNSGDEGVIRSKHDGDFNYGRHWSIRNGAWALNGHPAYAGPWSYATATYNSEQSSFPVLGKVGNNGGTWLEGNLKGTRFYYGIRQDVTLNEWHTFCYADDDESFVVGTDSEFYANDGRMMVAVVDPKTPVVQPSAVGTGEFWTSPAKIYFQPQVHLQTTVITGTVDFYIRSLNGTNVFYKINGGSWMDGGSRAITLNQSNFTTGTNTLQLYEVGNSTSVLTRTILKDPPYPSAGETHGFLAYGDADNLAKMLVRKGKPPYKYHWDKLKKSGEGARTEQDAAILTPGARGYPGAMSAHAMVARLEGITTLPPGKTKSYAMYAKDLLLRNFRKMDMVGFEKDWTQQVGPTAREFMYRGYFDCVIPRNLFLTYDTLIDIFRGDNPGILAGEKGISVCEDYMIRDDIAADVYDSVLFMGSIQGVTVGRDTGPTNHPRGSMWDVARKAVAIIGMFAIPTYSSPYYGTNGLDGNTTVYFNAPFPDQALTWKKIFLDEDATRLGYPNLAFRLGIENYNVATGDEVNSIVGFGDWLDGGSYVQNNTPVYGELLNILKYQYPSKAFPAVEEFFRKGLTGTLMSEKPKAGNGPTGHGPSQYTWLGYMNANFPTLADIGIPMVQNPAYSSTHANSDDQIINGSMPGIMAWYDVDYVPGTPTPTNIAPYFSTQPFGGAKLVGESITFTAIADGTPTPTRQWRKNGANISGQTGTTLVLTPLNLGSTGTYDCVATNVAGSTASAAASLAVTNPPDPDPEEPEEPAPGGSIPVRSAYAPEFAIQK